MNGNRHRVLPPAALDDLSARDRARVEQLSEPLRAKVLQTLGEILARDADNRDPVGQAILQVGADEREERQRGGVAPRS